jgi:hypothetical protein
MEFLIGGSVLAAGYFLTKTGNNHEKRNEKNTNSRINNNTIYNSNNIEQSKNIEKEKVIDNFSKSTDAINTNIVPPYFNQRIFNNQNNSIKYLQHPEHTRGKSTHNNIIMSRLSGESITQENFTHNNMVPFFGGSVKQNTYENANKPILEFHTGQYSNCIKKQEITPMFQPSKNINNTHGTKLSISEQLERYSQSNIRNNEVPIEPLKVGPGLANGFTSVPSGGYQQANMREYIMPKSVDEIRTKSNPKLSYKGRIITGKSVNDKRKIIGNVSKRRPETFYKSGPERHFTTVGSYTKNKLRPCIVYKDTNRKVSRSYHGTGQSVNKKSKMRSKYRKTSKNNYKTNGPRNANLSGQWKNEKFSDYGKKGINLGSNERDVTAVRTHTSNVTSIVKAIVAPLEDVLRTTKKENIIGNIRQTGNFKSKNPSKLTVYDPNDIARTTIKETNIHDTRSGYLKGPNRLTVYDPNNVARTTIRETNQNNKRNGNISAPNKLTIYDPNDIARTTIKETNIHDTRSGNMNSRSRGIVYDPNDVARTTIKETTEDDIRTGHLTAYQKAIVYDPNDIARTTIKETNIHDNRTGNMNSRSRGIIYDPNNVARTTIKETTEDDVRTGHLSAYQKNIIYDPNDIARTTIKETNIHDVRTGNLQNTVGNKGIVIDPLTNKAKTTIRNTTKPEDTILNMSTHNKPKVYDPNDIARTTIKETNIHNSRSGHMSSYSKGFVYDPNNIAKTTTKETTENNRRLGNVNNLEKLDGGYLTNPKNAPNTNRQFSSKEYTGAMGADVGGGYGYITNEQQVNNTNRQILSQEYSGTANSVNNKPKSYQDIYNATLNEVKEGTLKGRNPTPSNVSLTSGSENVNININKIEGDYINNRSPTTNKIYNSINQLQPCSVTQVKDQLDNNKIIERIEPSLLNAFNKNPYSKPLDSHFHS